MSPAPPDKCHKYLKVTYSSSCAALTGPGDHTSWAGTVDVARRFDLETGILNECAHHVLNTEMTCWGPPASDPTNCACPL